MGQDAINALQEQCTHQDPDYYKARRMGRFTRGDGKIRDYKYDGRSDTLYLPRGKFDAIRDVFRDFGFWRVVDDHRLDVPVDGGERLKSSATLWDFQDDLLEAMVRKENCLIRGGCGAGKSEIGLKLIERVGQNSIVIVWSRPLFDQWVERACARFGLRERDLGMIVGGRKFRLAPITIAMQQTLYKRLQDSTLAKKITGHFGVLIFDEVQRASAKTVREVVQPFPARYRVGISEDETRKDEKEFLIYDLFGDVAETVDITELEQRGVVHRVPIYVVPTGFHYEPYEHPRWRCNYHGCGEIYPSDQQMEDSGVAGKRSMRHDDRCLVHGCRGRVVADRDYHALLNAMVADEQRTHLARDVIQEQWAGGHTVVAFSDRVESCEVLSKTLRQIGVRNGLIVGDKKYKGQRTENMEWLRSGELRVVLGTAAIYQGIDVPRLDRGVVVLPKGSNRQLLSQQMGRLRRPERKCGICDEAVGQTKQDVADGTLSTICPHCGVQHKVDARLYYLWDEHIFPPHLTNLQRWFSNVWVFDSVTGDWVTVIRYKRLRKSRK